MSNSDDRYLWAGPDGLRLEAIDSHLHSLTGVECQASHFEYGRILLAMTESAVRADQLEPGSPPLRRIRQSIVLLSDMRVALDAIPIVEPDTLRFWSHRKGLIYETKAHSAPRINRNLLEDLVGRYLDLDFRCASVDRLLIDALVAMETSGYAHEIFTAQAFHWMGHAFAVTQRRPVRDLIVGRLVDALVFTGAGFGLWTLGISELIPQGWLWPGFAGLTAIYIAVTAWNVVSFPAYARATHSAQRKVLKPMEAMIDTYAALESTGPVSVTHIQELVAGAERAGVVWPATLYTMLEDVAARTRKL